MVGFSNQSAIVSPVGCVSDSVTHRHQLKSIKKIVAVKGFY